MKYKAKREEGKEEEGNDGVENRQVEGGVIGWIIDRRNVQHGTT
jgi:hypothetical protein